MPPKASAGRPVVLIHGSEGLLVRQRSRQLFEAWCREAGGFDHETIDAGANNADEALRAIARLREALQTLPFFGGSKVIWFQGCTFLGDDRTASSAGVTSTLAELANELAAFPWDNVRLVISAGKVDKRRTFFKTLERLGRVEECTGLDASDHEWEVKAEHHAQDRVREAGKDISPDALSALVAAVGPNLGQLQSETDKLLTYVGQRPCVETSDVAAVAVHNKQARAFALADALGQRDLARLLRTLDEELWSLHLDREKSEIGLLYGLVARVRTMLLARELEAEGLLPPGLGMSAFKARLARVPVDRFPGDRRYNPAMMHPFAFFNAYEQAQHYTRAELVGALERLLQCNLQLMSTTEQDEALILQRALVDICQAGSASPRREP